MTKLVDQAERRVDLTQLPITSCKTWPVIFMKKTGVYFQKLCRAASEGSLLSMLSLLLGVERELERIIVLDEAGERTLHDLQPDSFRTAYLEALRPFVISADDAMMAKILKPRAKEEKLP